MPKYLVIFAMAALAALSFAEAQEAGTKSPIVIAASAPLYPRTALLAHIQGAVTIRVSTDGERVSNLDVQSGPPMLAKAAKENIRTWRFEKHEPTVFLTTFEYVIAEPGGCEIENGTSTLDLPMKARISARDVQICDPVEPIHHENNR